MLLFTLTIIKTIDRISVKVFTQLDLLAYLEIPCSHHPTLELAAAEGVAVELIMKDISTVARHPERLWAWARIAADCAALREQLLRGKDVP
jgi:transcriptional antiterminator Rof (Rho-off)